MNLQAKTRWKRGLLGVSSLILLAAGAGWWKLSQYTSTFPIRPGLKASDASQNTAWPWKAAPQVLASGVKGWSTVSEDGTLLLLMRFDMGQNPRLKFSIWDSEAHDERPGDNLLKYWPHGVAQITKRLNSEWSGSGRQVLAASNGAFFGYANKVPGPGGVAFHVGPVVLDGKIFFNGANHRWTFGTREVSGRQVFDVVHLPSREQLGRFRWAAGSVQCLVKDGVELKMEPFPRNKSDFRAQPVASTDKEAGHVPFFDHMRTCRVSLAWSRDSKVLWWLVVKEPDLESGSSLALQHGIPLAGGWSVPDVQRFWMSLRKSAGDEVWCAINSDAGDVGQMIWKGAAGYEMIPPRWASNKMRIGLRPDFVGAPLGGPMMAFVVSG